MGTVEAKRYDGKILIFEEINVRFIYLIIYFLLISKIYDV